MEEKRFSQMIKNFRQVHREVKRDIQVLQRKNEQYENVAYFLDLFQRGFVGRTSSVQNRHIYAFLVKHYVLNPKKNAFVELSCVFVSQLQRFPELEQLVGRFPELSSGKLKDALNIPCSHCAGYTWTLCVHERDFAGDFRQTELWQICLSCTLIRRRFNQIFPDSSIFYLSK